MAARFASAASTLSMTPGRFFFIWIGVVNTSRAPAAKSWSKQ